MRAGPEGLKALFFEGFVLPFLVAWVGALAMPRAWLKRPPAAPMQERTT
jgi:hypothetical protein